MRSVRHQGSKQSSRNDFIFICIPSINHAMGEWMPVVLCGQPFIGDVHS